MDQVLTRRSDPEQSAKPMPGRAGAAVSTARLLLVENDAAEADLLLWYFRRESFDVRWVTSGEEAMLAADELAFDLVVLEWNLGRLSGIEVCRRLRKKTRTASVPIVMLTARSDESDRIRGLETGADDYVTKPFSPRELIARIGALLRRVRPASAGQSVRFADLEVDLATSEVRCAGHLLYLGPTEFRMARHFVEHPRRVFSREHLLDLLWPNNDEVGPRTVDVCIMRLRSALRRSGHVNLIRTVRGIGYSLDDLS